MLGSKIKLKTGSAIGPVSAGSLKTASAISASLQTVTDTAGNNSALQLSSAAVNIGSGTITNNGTLTIKGAGSNILSLRNSSNVEIATLSNSGIFTCNTSITTNEIYLQGGFQAIYNNTGRILLSNSSFNNFDILQFGATDATKPALFVNGANLECKLANKSALTAFSASQFTSSNLSAGTLTTARPVKFGDRATITEAGFIALGLSRQIAIEHNGVVYYIPCSLTVIP
jgi:hypothetical protein